MRKLSVFLVTEVFRFPSTFLVFPGTANQKLEKKTQQMSHCAHKKEAHKSCMQMTQGYKALFRFPLFFLLLFLRLCLFGQVKTIPSALSL